MADKVIIYDTFTKDGGAGMVGTMPPEPAATAEQQQRIDDAIAKVKSRIAKR